MQNLVQNTYSHDAKILKPANACWNGAHQQKTFTSAAFSRIHGSAQSKRAGIPSDPLVRINTVMLGRDRRPDLPYMSDGRKVTIRGMRKRSAMPATVATRKG